MTKQFRKYLILWGLFLMIFMAGVFADPSIADMYKWVDENNVAHCGSTAFQEQFSSPLVWEYFA